jgi:hypothetical protein
LALNAAAVSIETFQWKNHNGRKGQNAG